MSLRKVALVPGEYYHVYNRGIDKRSITEDENDSERFMLTVKAFNTVAPIGSLYEQSFNRENQGSTRDQALVDIIAYCLNPNHYHFILTPLVDKGIEKFMQRLGTGYTMYFNKKRNRSGSLFQGKYKASHIDTNEYLLHVSVYVNLNNLTHQLGGLASKLVRSSWNNYADVGLQNSIRCNTKIIRDQFGTSDEYKKFALSTLNEIIRRKTEQKSLQELLID